MRSKGANGVGRFNVEFEVANYGDIELARRGLLKPNQVRRQMIHGVVDSGAARFVLPGAVVKQLGLAITGKVRVRYADGRRATRPAAQGAYVKILDRDSTFTAVVEPKRETALIGAIVLEDLDLLVDCQQQRLVPRDPHGAIYEIE
ncbi:MAG: clan AA aspartic protease [Planctomycetes bacterium]|nr:clan AA aspartic protease [Planctomycetota bacterium]